MSQFIERFKGRTSAITKDGPLQMVKNASSNPIARASRN